MSYAIDHYSNAMAADAAADVRAAFVRRTYGHLALAILAFTGLEALLIQAVPKESILGMVSRPVSWLIVMVAFAGASYLANKWALSGQSLGMQYAGLALYVVAEAVIFLPLIYIATMFAGTELIAKAGILTLTMFAGLTVAVFITRSDFSYLAAFLSIGSCVALGVIVVAMFMHIDLGFWFAAAMIVLASGSILYSTSNVLHHYRADQHVAAALALFASVALLFYYVLILLLEMNRRN
jgi:FtsH-binding integral membrane protein